jgi:hypothetical protein
MYCLTRRRRVLGEGVVGTRDCEESWETGVFADRVASNPGNSGAGHSIGGDL